MSLLEVDNLVVRYPHQPRAAVDGLSFTIEAGESVALAGASGSGKTQTALAMMGLTLRSADVSGRVLFNGEDMLAATEAARRKQRANGIAMVFQDPSAALNPYLRIGEQLRIILEEHAIARGREAQKRVVDMLERTGLPDPERQARAYPFELSGGMRQRAMIASALIAGPSLLIADEPTTALDTTVQAQILALIRSLQAETGIALMLVTHDFGVIAHSTDRLLLLHEGRLIEQGQTAAVIAGPTHEQTRRMLDASRSHQTLIDDVVDGDVILEAKGLSVVYHRRPTGRIWQKQSLTALRPTALTLRRGETLAIVGESGSGKSTLARALLGLVSPASGSVHLHGKALPRLLQRRAPDSIAALQLVFQDPVGSLNPAWRVGRSVAEPLRAETAVARTARVAAVFERVDCPPVLLQRYPHELSGGQAQRAAIARTLAVQPEVLICDEAVAALDGPTRQGILELLAREQRERGLALIFISHDLGVVRRLSHRVMVMYMGQVVETASAAELFAEPRHPYTKALLDSELSIDSAEVSAPPLSGEVPSIVRPPAGCVFHPRCAHATERCRRDVPVLREVDNTVVACHRAEEL